MEKKDAMEQLHKLARQYQVNLANRNFLFIFDLSGNYQYFEVAFFKRNFLHLTGIKLTDNNSAINFYNQCLHKRIPADGFAFKQDGTTEQKFAVLPSLFDFRSGFKMLGEYNYSKKLLYADKLCGGVHGCIGFVQDKCSAYFVPDTSLQEDIRNLVLKPYKIEAILDKQIRDNCYSNIIYCSKKLNLIDLSHISIFDRKIDWNMIIAKYE